MRYLGNKTGLLDFIEKPLIENNIKNGTFFDIFSGTASVAKYFKKKNIKLFQMIICYTHTYFKKHMLKIMRRK